MLIPANTAPGMLHTRERLLNFFDELQRRTAPAIDVRTRREISGRKIAVVAGASRGAGATVYVTARTSLDGPPRGNAPA